MARKRRVSQTSMLLETPIATAVVLGLRVPQLLTGRMTPRERERMVAEKIEAFAESQSAVTTQLGRMMVHPARTPTGFAAAAAGLAAAAMAPYHSKVKANAKRLTLRRSKFL
jgi:hypothetical protein